ncbi:MAG: hypothetical protein MOB07_17905 [Acidobacteria bacterium]|nr:hypothetical protein [Acidobacteriota bacterium]
MIAARFFAAHPEWADERIGTHIHEIRSAQRPILTERRPSLRPSLEHCLYRTAPPAAQIA